MPIKKASEAHDGHVERVARLHSVLEAEELGCDAAVSAAAELLGLVLLNSIPDLPECLKVASAISEDILDYIRQNYPDAVAQRSMIDNLPTTRN